MVLTRRHALLGAAAMLAAGTPTVVRAQTLTPLRYGSTPLVDGVPIYYAAQTGMFRSEGLDVTVNKLGSTSVIAAALVGGAVEVGEVSAQPLVNAHVRGIDLQIVYPCTFHITGRPYNAAIVVAADFDYKTAKELNGTTMSSAGVGDSGWLAARVFIDANGGDSATIKFVEVPFSTVAAAIEAHRIVGGVCVDPYFSDGVKSGKIKSVGDLQAGFGPRLIQTAYAATAEYVGKNRDACARFARVARTANEYLNTHRADFLSYTERFTGVEPAKQTPEATFFTTNYTPKDLQPWIDAAVKYKLIDKPFDASILFAKLR
jgi:NitT/TauT family transport system substrate-binding protein